MINLSGSQKTHIYFIILFYLILLIFMHYSIILDKRYNIFYWFLLLTNKPISGITILLYVENDFFLKGNY